MTVGLRWGTIARVLSWAVILVVAAAIIAAVLVPRLVGAIPYTVLSGSMSPTYPPGTLVVVKPVKVEEVSIGQVVTYQLSSGRPTVATHRVVGLANDLRGERLLTTQGDANEVPDPEPVRGVQVKGKVWYSVPYLGHVNSIISGRQRQIVLYVVVTALLVYAAYMFASTVRDKHRDRPAERKVDR